MLTPETPQFEPYLALAEQRCQEAGFHAKSLSELNLPEVESFLTQDQTLARYQIHGDAKAAQTLVFCGIPFSTYLQDESIQVRLAAQQAILGPDYCVVGHEVFSPAIGGFSHEQLKLSAEQSMAILAQRVQEVVGRVEPSADQDIVQYGFSMGADVASAYTFQNLTNPSFGQFPVDRLGVFEPVAVKLYGAGFLSLAKDFMQSGGDLYKNILASQSPALLEADGIDPDKLAASLRYQARVGAGLLAYLGENLSSSLGMAGALATNLTLSNLGDLTSSRLEFNAEVPDQVVGVSSNGKLADQLISSLAPSEKRWTFEFDGDHSAADRLQTSGALILATVTEPFPLEA